MAGFEREGPIAVLAVSREGLLLGRRLAAGLRVLAGREEVEVHEPVSEPLTQLVGRLWSSHAGIVGVMATGIMVRALAPWLQSKHTDPAVVVVDDAGRYAVSLLSGHEGGANRLAELVAELTRGLPVVTTGGEARKRVVVGVGTRRGVSSQAVMSAVERATQQVGYDLADIRALSTLDLKVSEAAIRQVASALGVPLQCVTRHRVQDLQEALRQENFVESKIGVASACVPAALLGGPEVILAGPRVTGDGVAVAVAVDVCGSWVSVPEEENI